MMAESLERFSTVLSGVFATSACFWVYQPMASTRYCIIYLFLKNRHKNAGPAGHFEKLPLVTVQLPVFNEYFVIRRLIEAVSKLDYPKELLQIQILDDSTDETRDIAADGLSGCARRDSTSRTFIAPAATDSRPAPWPRGWSRRKAITFSFSTPTSCRSRTS